MSKSADVDSSSVPLIVTTNEPSFGIGSGDSDGDVGVLLLLGGNTAVPGDRLDGTERTAGGTSLGGAFSRRNSSSQRHAITSLSPGSADSEHGFELGYKAKSCRSFIRQPKLSTEHRNKSVPHSLQVLVK
ncbi:unnamed protein product [Hermetia illucens]|uniref:Uncharacterized protein n=1 Tax=Hermetia illucens TaxID=343691 RepID=A0A7R8UCF0_HERIL|nr:unnamed protein product [Hermetia illucens]